MHETDINFNIITRKCIDLLILPNKHATASMSLKLKFLGSNVRMNILESHFSCIIGECAVDRPHRQQDVATSSLKPSVYYMYHQV
jgi:hypothetical protein